jgi:hypothetical protein
MVMHRHGGFVWVSIFVASIAVLGEAQLSFAEDVTPAQAGEQLAVEGTFIRVAANEEGWVTVAYRTANEAVGEEYMLLRAGMTLTDTKGTQTITRDDIKLVTPDNQVLPLMTQEEAERASGNLSMLTKRAAMDTDSVNYFPNTADRPCELRFFSAIAVPRATLAYDQVELASQTACVGVLYFHVPDGIQYGNYNLDVHFENSIVKVPMEIMTKEREKEFTKQWKAALKEQRKK